MNSNMEDNIKLPKYYRLKQILRRDILKGKYQPGAAIPSENELQKKYNVSCTTVRRALSDLVHERLLVRGQGMGTFVNKPPVERSLRKILSFTGNMLEMGYKPLAKVIKKELITCPEEVAIYLSTNQWIKVLFLERLCFGDDIPMMYENIYVREDMCPGIYEKDFSGSLTKILHEDYGHKITRIYQTLQFREPDSYIRGSMEITDNSIPFFYVEGTQSQETGLPIIYEYAFYRGDMYRFKIDISEG